MASVHIRKAEKKDFKLIWPIFYEIVSAGKTYAYPVDTDIKEAERLWIQIPEKTFVLEDNGRISGTYYIKTNHPGQGSHVCNCGYMVSSECRGKGFATLMCEHSQKIALELGYKAMQFNFVASSNKGAIRLWHKLGFETAGCLQKAFNHPQMGYINAFIMYKWLY